MPKAAIPTTYAGANFRSMLEARWAAMFDTLGWEWDYEPFELSGYIPDFTIRWPTGELLVEVKPAWNSGDLDTNHARDKINQAGWEHRFLMVGAYPDLHATGVTPDGYTIFGHLDQRDETDQNTDACLIWCLNCEGYGLNSWVGSYRCARCGHYDGDSHFAPIRSVNIKTMWRTAGNSVQWRPRRNRIHPRHNEWERGY